jgi:hypothetical protein
MLSWREQREVLSKTCLLGFFCVCFFGSTGVELRASRSFYHLSHFASPFAVMSFFKIGSHKLFVGGWLQIVIFLICVS